MADIAEAQVLQVRRLCLSLQGTSEKLSHGEPAFFTGKKMFAMFANNHHRDGRVAVWILTPPGDQAMLIHTRPETYFFPPYVGVRGWVGIELSEIDEEELSVHLLEAWKLSMPKRNSTAVS